jgi:hypothetical protein
MDIAVEGLSDRLYQVQLKAFSNGMVERLQRTYRDEFYACVDLEPRLAPVVGLTRFGGHPEARGPTFPPRRSTELTPVRWAPESWYTDDVQQGGPDAEPETCLPV